MVKQIRCYLEQLSHYGKDVYHVSLLPEERISFSAGQYLKVVMGETDKRPFSIANAPQVDNRIELHIGASEDNRYTGEVLERLVKNGELLIELPFGDASFQGGERPLLFLAGGTGFAYAHSIIEHCLLQKLNNPITLYWGVREAEYMYAASLAKEWQLLCPDFRFIPVVEFPQSYWQGRTGLVHQAVLDDGVVLEGFDIYIAGRFEMAKVARDAFVEAGADPVRIFGDAFSFL